MDPNLKRALESGNLPELTARAALYADTIIRKYIWRGFRPNGNQKKTDSSPNARSAEDFVSDAFERLLDGRRTFNPKKSLLDNINSITESLISSAKKTSDRTPLVDYAETEEFVTPLETAVAPEGETGHEVVNSEILDAQRWAYANLYNSFDGDALVQQYLEAMSEDITKPQDIAELLNIPVEKVYELRRMMKTHLKELFGTQNFGELKRKVLEG